MKKVIFTLLALCPSFLHVAIRRMMGQKIGKGVKIKFGTLLYARQVAIGDRSRIGPFTYIQAHELQIGENTMIKSLAILKTRRIELADYVHIAPLCVINSEFTVNSALSVGDHSRIFPFCWLDTGEGIRIGKQVGVGGHTLMFTHGVWSNFIDGGPVSLGPITIENNVWLPWRVFILPNVTIGENAIIGANSLINKNIDANSLAAGNPAKVIREFHFDPSHRKERFITVLKEYSTYLEFKSGIRSTFENNCLDFGHLKFSIDDAGGLHPKDLLILIDNTDIPVGETLEKGISVLAYDKLTMHLNGNKSREVLDFISYLRRFGLRLYIDKTRK